MLISRLHAVLPGKSTADTEQSMNCAYELLKWKKERMYA